MAPSTASLTDCRGEDLRTVVLLPVQHAGGPARQHHYASLLLAAGESVVAVAERLGHENATLVLTTYGHLMLDSEDRKRRTIDTAWTVDMKLKDSNPDLFHAIDSRAA